MKHRPNKKKEREAVNAARTFFEANGCVFQDVDTGNDYGKDAYVDIGDEHDVTGLCVALQIKGGASFRLPDGSYKIPLDDSHRKIWSEAILPVIGIIYDPDDLLLRWCDISGFLASSSASKSAIPVKRDAILDAKALRTSFRETARLAARHGHPLLDLISGTPDVVGSAAVDCLALARLDARVLIGLRYLLRAIVDQDAFLTALRALAHAGSHPDIAWTDRNWIPDPGRTQIRKHFRWTEDEVKLFIQMVPFELYERGGSGQDVVVLLDEDPATERTLWNVAEALVDTDLEHAFVALYLSLYWSRDAQTAYRTFVTRHFGIRAHSLAPELETLLRDFGEVSLF